MPSEAATMQGSIDSGRFRLQRQLAHADGKDVYLAYDTRLQRYVAITLINKTLGAALRARLLDAWRALAAIGEHPCVVPVYQAGEEEHRPYVVSQYLEDDTIPGLLKRTRTHRWPVAYAIRIAVQVSQALEWVHRHGVIHGNVKPSNVWLTQHGTAKLGDFSSAVLRHATARTADGHGGGIASHTVPESIRRREPNVCTDLYGLGVIVYEMLTGCLPLCCDAEGSAAPLDTPGVAPSLYSPEIPEPLDVLVLELMASDPQRRPRSASAVRAALEGIAASVNDGGTAVTRPDAVDEVSPAQGEGFDIPLPETRWVRERQSPGQPATDATPPGQRRYGRASGWPEHGPFVGRKSEMGALHAALSDAFAGNGRFLLLEGELGIGRTRLASEFANQARLRSAEVLWATCLGDGGTPSYWPWIQILRAYVRRHGLSELADESSGCADLVELIAAASGERPKLGPVSPEHIDVARDGLFHSIASILKTSAERQPLVVILDDIDRADGASLAALGIAIKELKDTRLLLIGTAADGGPGCHELIRNLMGERVSRRIRLHQLVAADVAEYIESLCGTAPQALVAALHRESEGNPLCIRQFMYLLHAEGCLDDDAEENTWKAVITPQNSHELVLRRLMRLSEDCLGTLTLGAAIGDDFDTRTIAALVADGAMPVGEALRGKLPSVSAAEWFTFRRAPENFLTALEEGVAVGIIRRIQDGNRWSFAHRLIREALYQRLDHAVRVRLHRRVAEVCERLHANGAEAQVTQLAHHFLIAAHDGDVAHKACTYATRAGHRDVVLLADREAAAWYARALEALGMTGRADDRQRGALLLNLAEAQARAGDLLTAGANFARATVLARALGSTDWLARAALGRAQCVDRGEADASVCAQLEEALRAVGADSGMRAKLLTRMGQVLYRSGVRDRAVRLTAEAVATARCAGDPAVLAQALAVQYLQLDGPAHVEERLAIATEVAGLAAEIGDDDEAITACAWRIDELLAVGDLDAVIDEADVFARLAEQSRQARYQSAADVYRATAALLHGRVAEAKRLMDRAYSTSDQTPLPGVRPSAAQRLLQLREAGLAAAGIRRWREAETHFDAAVRLAQEIHYTAWTAISQYEYAAMLLRRGAAVDRQRILSLLQSGLDSAQQLGMPWLVAKLLELKGSAERPPWWSNATIEVPSPRSPEPPRDETAIVVFTEIESLDADEHQAEDAARLRTGVIIREHTTSHGGREVTAREDGIVLAFASADDALHCAMAIQQAISRYSDQHPEVGVRMRIGLQPGKALEGIEGARAVPAHSAPGTSDPAPSDACADERSDEPVGPTGERPPAARASRTPARGPEGVRPEACVFRIEGDYWTIRYKGSVQRVRDLKGLHYLAHLLQHPGREFHVRDMITEVEGAAVPGPQGEVGDVPPLGDAGYVLDPKAKAAYRQRLGELRAELEEAERFNDLGHAQRAREEMEFLSAQLASAMGLGGRDRVASSDAERARLAVTKRIKTAVKRIGEVNPDLSRYFFVTVNTGYFCSYRPDRSEPISWLF